MKVAIAGGGTAGHVNPALALAHVLHDAEVTFIGTARGAEARLVPAAGFRLKTLAIRGFDRARPLSMIPTGWIAMRAVAAASAVLRRDPPDVVVSMGGYVGLPVCVAARRLDIPVVVHEQNIVLGLANRLSVHLAAAVAVSFEDTLARVRGKGVFVGNPVLPEVTAFDRDAERDAALARFGLAPDRRTLLVFGGSQGARRINDAARGLLRWWADRADMQVVHIEGSTHPAASPPQDDGGDGGGLIYRRMSFVHRMVQAYAAADLAVCRGGATTVAELCVVGLPSLIVPYPYHRDRQQELHGRVLERAGAAKVIADEDATSERIAAEAGRLLFDDASLSTMSKAALSLGRPEAASALADVVRGAAR